MPADARDEELMLAYANGDAGAFDDLYARHKGGVYRYVLRHCNNNAAIANDLFQDIWMNAIRVRASYAPTAKFTTWIYTLARNRIVDHWRATGQATLVSVDDESDQATCVAVHTMAASRIDEPHTRVANRELSVRLKDALTALPPAQRDAFLLQYESGFALADIAAMTGVGIETVRSRLRYAIAKLRADLVELREAPE